MKLTRQQEKVFEYICAFSDENGFPPSYSNIAKHFQFSSDGTVRTYLEHLEKKGYIQRMGHARGIRILKPIKNETCIPIIGRIAAGEPILAIENHIGTLDDISEIKQTNGRFALEVKGDSMKDAGILDGDLAIIQTNVSINNGQIGAAIVEGSATLKRIYYENNRIRLQPENEHYDPIYINKTHADSSLVGRYIALVRKA